MARVTPLVPAARAGRIGRAATLIALALLAAACPGAREPSVDEVIEASVRHEARLLELIDTNRARPDAARRAVAEYVAANGEELDALASRRALLEREPGKFAQAMQAHGAALASNLERRRRLLESAPELMADPEVRAALGRLAAL